MRWGAWWFRGARGAGVLAVLFCGSFGCSSDGAPVLRDCDTSAECQGGEICRGNQCREACSVDDPCSGSLGACDEAQGFCVECVVDGDCTGGQVCDEQRCVEAECSDDADCRGGERCSAGACVPLRAGCDDDDDCRGGERCDAGECVAIGSDCEGNSDCGGGERCDAGTCVPISMECSGPDDCAAGERCDAGECVPAPDECSGDGDCRGGERCSGGSCVPIGDECAGPQDCGADEMCDAGSCVPATPTGCQRDNDCGANERCNAEGDCVPVMPSGACNKLDLLLVIDDSGSMSEEQMNLGLQGRAIVDALNGLGDGDVDWRVGVTTTGKNITVTLDFMGFPMILNEMGPEGALLQPSACGMSRKWVERGDSDAALQINCLADVGTMGSSYEMPLLMSQWAVTDRVADGMNAGFLREDAMLGVIVLTDEDDCSLLASEVTVSLLGGDVCADPIDVPGFIGAMDTAKGGRENWAMYFIAGPGPGTCSGPFGEADEAHRLKDVVSMSPANAALESICIGDLALPFTRGVRHVHAACEGS